MIGQVLLSGPDLARKDYQAGAQEAAMQVLISTTAILIVAFLSFQISLLLGRWLLSLMLDSMQRVTPKGGRPS